jgi:hypothetical protein
MGVNGQMRLFEQSDKTLGPIAISAELPNSNFTNATKGVYLRMDYVEYLKIPEEFGDFVSNATVNDNIPYQNDFRSVYNSILKNWFCVNETNELQIMLKKFPTLPLINASVCGVAMESSVFSGNSMINNYPNPFNAFTRIEFKTNGGPTLLQLLDTTGAVIKILIDTTYAYAGMNSYTLFGNNLHAGVYYIRVQNGVNQYVKTIIKL